ncbi:hypothetical protein AK830_g4362 [Neonectria ditissima]|uniref:Phytanoyl-CoA dioxygenase n=1 Tax=Neonectria ditissima TaxID=78410 RepID=A0A0P7B8Z3_9HYPO|nr:hypothetical protein AK830_g4362 [Neonectria ditissima]
MFARASHLTRSSARFPSSQAIARYTSIPSLWMSAPATTHSRHFSRLTRTSSGAEVAKALKDDGCVVIESMLTTSQVSRLNRDVDAGLANAATGKSANANTPPLAGVVDADIYGQNTKRLGDLLNASATIREEIVDNDSLHDISAEIFKEMNGATGVVRGSHEIKYSEVVDDPTFEFWRYPEEEVEQIELKAGDCLLLGGRIVHRGEENKTTDEFRRLLSCTVISAALTPEEAHPLLLKEEMAKELPQRAKRFLGFRELATVIGPDHRQGGLKRRLGF